MNHKNRTKEIIKSIISHKPFYIALKEYINDFSFDNKEIASTIDKSRKELGLTTAKRRTSTVVSWIKWILLSVSPFENKE